MSIPLIISLYHEPLYLIMNLCDTHRLPWEMSTSFTIIWAFKIYGVKV